MSRWGVAKQEKLTAGAVRCGTARMPDPMLVPTINATAPATLPLRAPLGGATAWSATPGTSRPLSPAAAATHHLPPPPERPLGTCRTRAAGQPNVTRRALGHSAARAMAPCIGGEELPWRAPSRLGVGAAQTLPGGDSPRRLVLR